MSEIIRAPFTDEQVTYLNELQQGKRAGFTHGYTCCSPEDITECQRRKKENDGMLIASTNGWVCPCGKYTQNWAFGYTDEEANS